MIKKCTTLLLLLAILLCTAVSCKETPASNPTDTTPNKESESQSEVSTEETRFNRAAISDDLPENDFGGRTFTVIGESDDYEKYITVEEQNGEGVNDAVYNRNLTVDDRYNAKVAFNAAGNYEKCSKIISNCINADDPTAFDLIQYHVVENSGNAMKGLYENWYNIPYIDFSKPWWSSSNTEDLSLNNRCFLAMGDFALSTIFKTYCMFYDKDVIKNYTELEDMYTVVKDGRWTMDALKRLAEIGYTDKNGNGEVDDGDYYGFSTDLQSNVNTYQWSCDNPIFRKNNQGELEYVYFSEKLVNVFDACYDLLYQTNGIYKNSTHWSGMKVFSEYNSLICNACLGGSITELADYENEFGIIPYPKYDEAQAEYKTMVDGGHEAMAVGKNVRDREFVGTMTEVLCAETYKQVLPAYYDVCLKQRYASSPEDAEMIDLCIASRVFDLGYVYDNWKGVSFFFQGNLGTKKHADIATYYRSKAKSVEKYYDSVLKLFTEEEA